MVMKHNWCHSIAIALTGGLMVVSAGCDGGVSREEPVAETAAEQPKTQSSDDFSSGGASTYGKARGAAVRSVELQEQRQKELSDLATPGGEKP